MATDLRSIDLPPAVTARLHEVRAYKRRLGLGTAIVTAFAVLFAMMLLAMFVDWFVMPFGTTFRSLLTTFALGTAAAALVAGIATALFHGHKLRQIAREVDRAVPRLEERWSTVAEIHDAPPEHQAQVHPAMMRQVSREAARWTANIEPDEIISARWLYRAFFSLAAGMLVLVILVFADWRQTFLLMRRFWAPQAPITFTQIRDVTGDMLTARGEPLQIEARLDGQPVDVATLIVKPTDGPDEQVVLIPGGDDGKELSHRVRAADQSFSFSLRAGDAQTAWHKVIVANRPDLAAVRFKVTPPDYTQREPKSLKQFPPSATIVEGSRLELAFLPKETVESFDLQVSKDETLQLQSDDEGWYRWQSMVHEDLELSPNLTESHGLQLKRPPVCYVHVYRDQAPSVEVVSPTNEMAVQPGDNVEIQFRAEDDFAIGKAELIVYEESNVPGGEPIELSVEEISLGDQQNSKSIRGTVNLDLSQYELENGGELTYAIRVYDTRQAPPPQNYVAAAPPQSAPADVIATDGPQASEPQRDTDDPAALVATEQLAGDHASSDAAANDEMSMGGEQRQNSDSSPTPESLAAGDGEPPTESPEPPVADDVSQTASDTSSTAPPTTPTADSQETGEPPAEAVARQQPGNTPTGRSLLPRLPNFLPRIPGITPPIPGGIGASNDSKSPTTDRPTRPGSAEPGATPPNTSGLASAANENESATSDPEPGADEVANASPNQANQPSSDPSANVSDTSSGSGEQQNLVSGAENGEQMIGLESTATTERRSLAGNSSQQSGTPPTEGTTPNGSSGSRAQTDQMASESQSAGRPSGNESQQQPQADQMASESPTGGGNPSSTSNQQGQRGDVAVPPGGQMASSRPDQDKQDGGGEMTGAPRPADSMTRRMLDVAQSGSSGRQRLKIDEWAGNFAGQQREKLALAISPVLDELDKHLERAEVRSQEMIDHLTARQTWTGAQDRQVGQADRALEEAQETVGKLDRQSAGTPYAFIGLQLNDINQAHIGPARDAFWSALQSDDNRLGHVRSAWQEIGRARERLAGLGRQFQRIRREHQLAEAVQQVEKMYQVFIEDAFTLLGTDRSAINNYERQTAQFELDEEYLSRLREVLEMRRDLMAELARILSEDPRLLRRFMDRFVDSRDSLRDQLTLQAERQKQLERELRAWLTVEEDRRPALISAIVRIRLEESTEISDLASRLSERFVAWLPLELEIRDGDLSRARDAVQNIASKARTLQLTVANYRAGSGQNGEDAQPSYGTPKAGSLADVAAKGRDLYEDLKQLDATLRAVSLSGNNQRLATHIVNRLAETRELVERTSGWISKIEELDKGQYARMAAVDQHQLANDTQTLAAKLVDIEVQLANMLQNQNSTLPAEIADKSRQLLAVFDGQLGPNQLGATYALRNRRLPNAAIRQRNAVKAFAEAEKLFDELIQLTIQELDELPVQDPIADLLDDPTLDELLAQLENEALLQELLGIPDRPSNLQIMGDWLRPMRGQGQNAQMRMMIASRMQQQQQEAQYKLQEAYERALARALNEAEELSKVPERNKKEAAVKQADWNTVVAQLRDDLLQGRGQMPPEEFRRAIEQYFDLISRAKTVDD